MLKHNLARFPFAQQGALTMSSIIFSAACPSAEVDSVVPLGVAWSRAEVRCQAELGPVLDAVAAALTGADFPAEDVRAVRLAVQEALFNGIKHGHKGDPSKAVRLAWRCGHQGVLARVEDDGPGFNPSLLPSPLDPVTGERRGGRGLLLIAACMNAVSYSRQHRCLTLWKRRTASL
jgi:anti-sigma regulatory factor (Ser/Thr protein kinase)